MPARPVPIHTKPHIANAFIYGLFALFLGSGSCSWINVDFCPDLMS